MANTIFDCFSIDSILILIFIFHIDGGDISLLDVAGAVAAAVGKVRIIQLRT